MIETRPTNQKGAAEVLGSDNAFQYAVHPLDLHGKTLVVAAAYLDTSRMEQLGALLRHRLDVVETWPRERINEANRKLYHRGPRSGFAVAVNAAIEKNASATVDEVIEAAVQAHASDIHFEPNDHGGRVRLRVDKSLWPVRDFDADTFRAVTSVLKRLSDLKLDASQIFQDGSFKTTTKNGRSVDVRTSVIPVESGASDGGEKTVLRLLGNAATLRRFEELGMPPELQQSYGKALRKGSGLHLIVGPTGSGKTTSAFSILAGLPADMNVCTVEDPVEVRLPHAYQVSVDERQNRTFATALRAFVRQDPDCILCGEIRDAETAQQSSAIGLSGIPIIGTAHAPDAPRAVQRLIEFGVTRSTIAQSLRTVLAQRRLPRLCPACKRLEAASTLLARTYPGFFGGDEAERPVYRRASPQEARACGVCRGTGVHGARAVFEFFEVTDAIEDAISAGSSRTRLTQLAVERGYRPLRDHAVQLLAEGEVGLEDIHIAAIDIEPASFAGAG